METKCLDEFLEVFCKIMDLALIDSIAPLYRWSVGPIKYKNSNTWQLQLTAETIVKIPNSRVQTNLCALPITTLRCCLCLIHPDTMEDQILISFPEGDALTCNLFQCEHNSPDVAFSQSLL